MNTLKQVLTDILNVSIGSLGIGLIVGGVIGLVIGIWKHRIGITLFHAILGSFLGTMVVAFVPLFSMRPPVNIYTAVPAGSIAGGIVGGLKLSRLPTPLRWRTTWVSILVAYLLLISGILIRVVLFRSKT